MPEKPNSAPPLLLLLLAGCLLGVCLLAVGCVTPSTLDSRKLERYTSYSELTSEQRTAVDLGNIKVGMTQDAVYIAWGKPSQVLTGESSSGNTVTWLYHGTSYQEYSSWGYPYYGFYGGRRRYYYAGPSLTYEYYPRAYIRAQVRFENGVVKEWHTTPAPR